jgi:arylsulfatase
VSGSSLPRPPRPFAGEARRLVDDSTPAVMERDEPPFGAPNVVLIMLDDVGFGTFSAFGGPVPTRVCDRIAAQGLRYNQFHTTALCSPTRAALLTGRNHHAVHMGGIPEGANSFPGYDSVIPRSAATVAEILRLNGYATGCFGKWHLTPTWEQGPAGPFDRWPTGVGFERFYGIINAEASQWEPPVYDQTTPVAPYVGRPDYHLTEDLADQAIRWLDQIGATAPDRPFFLYFPTAAVHTPHHVPSEWIDRFRGAFDDGWDALREQIYERQLEQGVIPPDTRLTPRPAQIPAWEDYPERYRPVAARLMETFAAFVAHTDHHIGRVLDAIDRSGRGDDTLVLYLTGDNGASAEGTIHGAWGAPSFQNGVPEDPEWLLERMDDFGTARCENHYNVGWAWALDSPFQWVKQVASHFGGTRNGLAVQWPKAITDAGAVRDQFHHVVDIASTILIAAGVAPPDVVHGVEQQPVDGIPMNDSFTDATAPGRTTQYFEMLGNRAMYHDGWIASCFHGRVPWNRFEAAPFDGPQERWELYDVRHDFSQSIDLADAHPDVLADLQRRFDEVAQANQVYPLRDPSMRRTSESAVPNALAGATSMTYTTAHVRIPEPIVVNLKNCSWRITADIETGADVVAVGVIACQGGNMNGWSLYLDAEGRPTFLYNCFGRELTYAIAPDRLAAGRHRIVAEFASDGGIGAGGRLALLIDDLDVAEARLERTVPVVFSMSGETFDVGIDTGAPVGTYPHLFECTATIFGVTLERLSQPTPAESAELADREFRASVSSQ